MCHISHPFPFWGSFISIHCWLSFSFFSSIPSNSHMHVIHSKTYKSLIEIHQLTSFACYFMSIVHSRPTESFLFHLLLFTFREKNKYRKFWTMDDLPSTKISPISCHLLQIPNSEYKTEPFKIADWRALKDIEQNKYWHNFLNIWQLSRGW